LVREKCIISSCVYKMQKILTAILLLISGLAAYWFFRPSVYFFELFGVNNSNTIVISDNALSLFAKNYFADIVWCIAVFQIASLLMQRKYPSLYFYSLIALPFLSEILQGFKIIRGSFDWIDILIYSSLLVLFYHKKTFHMQKLTKHFAGVSVTVFFILAMLASAGPRKTTYKPPPPLVYTSGTIKLPEKKDEIFSKPSLSRILQTASNLSIVLRVPGQITKVLEEGKFATNSIYNTVEKEIAKAGFTVRDRGLFQQVLENTSVDYSKIKELTGTDLILELVGYEKVKYPVSDYKDQDGNEKAVKASGLTITGAKAEFKIISVKENDFVGSYIFYSTPCTNGCTYKFNQYGETSASTDSYSTNIEVENFFKDCALRLIKELRPK
jgi:hypothetical protein